MNSIFSRPYVRAIGVTIIVLTVALLIVVAWAVSRHLAYRQEAPLRAGISAMKDGDFQSALRNIEPFAQSENRLAQELLGDIYAFGLSVPVDDIKAGIWYRRAECGCSVTGKIEYYTGLGYLDEVSIPVPGDSTRALIWIRRAAEAGYPKAQQLLADPVKLAEKGLVFDSDTIDYWQSFLESE